MTEKLVKTGNDYILYSKDKTVLGITSGTMEGRMLSLKNCQAIENGYDLDELAVLSTKEETTIVGNQKMAQGFIKGFQKALELLGDKKYNYGHLDKMFTCGKLYQDSKNEAYCFDNVLSKFEQNEWDVEIVMDICGDKVYAVPEPVLDVDGCLILRRI